MTLGLWGIVVAFAIVFGAALIFANKRSNKWWRHWEEYATHPRQLLLVLPPPGTYACSHMAIAGVTSASCGLCGPLSRVA